MIPWEPADGGTHPPTDTGFDDAGMPNANVERGKELYALHCAPCHGPQGLGTANGSDLSEEVPEHSDREIVRVVLEGKDDMPALPLPAPDVNDIVAYLRSLFGQEEGD